LIQSLRVSLLPDDDEDIIFFEYIIFNKTGLMSARESGRKRDLKHDI